MTPEEYFDGHPLALAVFGAVRALIDGMGGADIRATKSQVAFRRRRGYAYVWLPGRYLAHPAADVVLSIGLGRHDNLYYNTGHGHVGWTMACGSARMLADLIDCRRPDIDPTPYAPVYGRRHSS